MSGGSIGPLLESDEYFNHQIVETFATVAQTDLAWTEKVCLMAAARDGSLQIALGLGKYINRDVLDGYAGISRGVEQWNVRASRELHLDPEKLSVGPIRYEILEPLRKIRAVLHPNPVQPIAFDLIFEGVVPCFAEEREDRRTFRGYRRTADQIRYHQTGHATGWVELEGYRTPINRDEWVMTRDHSWGIRPGVGSPVGDVTPEPMDSDQMQKVLAIWNPVYFQSSDGRVYAAHLYYLHYSGNGFLHERFQGHLEYPDGSRQSFIGFEPKLNFNPVNRRLLGGEFRLKLPDGQIRVWRVRPIRQTGFHLGGGLYHGMDGKHHGQWRGPFHLEGEYFADCSQPEAVSRLNQFRDCFIEVHDDIGSAIGWGNCQTFVLGDWPEMGLQEPSSSRGKNV
jgi:hypothetical protein